jgi:hypothetical protein
MRTLAIWLLVGAGLLAAALIAVWLLGIAYVLTD